MLEARAKGHPEVLKLTTTGESTLLSDSGMATSKQPAPEAKQGTSPGVEALQRASPHSINIPSRHRALLSLQQIAQEPPALKDRTCRNSLPKKTQG